MSWHLFKGGVRTELIDKFQSNRVFEEALVKMEEKRDSQIDKAYRQLEEYKETSLQKKEDDGLRIRRQSISNLMKNADKGDAQRPNWEFKADEEYWTKDIRLIMQSAAEDDSFVKMITKKVRELVPYSQAFINEKRRPTFKKEY